MNQAYNSDTFIVAIDGPVGSGKSSVGRLVAKQLGFLYVDTGAIYRSVAYQVHKTKVNLNDESAVVHVCQNLNLKFGNSAEKTVVFVADQNITEEIRLPEISMMASKVSSLKCVRDNLIDIQRSSVVGHKGAVLDGRDIGTVIFPNAPVKVFLEASPEIRAKRRFDELVAKGQSVVYENVLTDLQKRDYQDTNRETAPLKVALDASVINTSSLSIQEVVDNIVCIVKSIKNSRVL